MESIFHLQGPRREGASLSSTADQHLEPVSYAALVRGNANFRNLWLGQIVSLLGDWFNLIASATLVAQLSQTGFAIGTLFVVRMLAPFVISPLAGVVADRYNRKHILIVTDITRAVTVLGFFLVSQPQHLWLLYFLTAIQLGISGFFFPTRNAILPDLVSDRELGAANALSSTTWSVMLALGAALGGIMSGIWGIYPAFVIDALTFVLSAFFIFRVNYQDSPHLEPSEKSIRRGLRQYLEGLRYLHRHVDVLAISLHKAASALFVSGFQVVQVIITESIFTMGEAGGISLGLMFAVAGVGTGIGPILARRFTGDRDPDLRLVIILGYGLASLGLMITAPLTSFPMVLFGTFLRGAGGGIIWVFSTQLLMQLVPNQVRGRVFSTEFSIFTLTSAIGASVAGAALDSALGIAGTIGWMAAFTLLPGIFWAFWMRRT
jgi:MFS family permease